ncbi:MAG: hypothetical protein WCH07_07750 [Deltaproteobacteria bacterium]
MPFSKVDKMTFFSRSYGKTLDGKLNKIRIDMKSILDMVLNFIFMIIAYVKRRDKAS